jgi:hypothetical protein
MGGCGRFGGCGCCCTFGGWGHNGGRFIYGCGFNRNPPFSFGGYHNGFSVGGHNNGFYGPRYTGFYN